MIDFNFKLEQARKAAEAALGNYIKPKACPGMLATREDELRVRGDGLVEVHTKGGWVPADEQGLKAWAYQVAAGAGTSDRLPSAGINEQEMLELMRRQRKAAGY
jgi:hypothetical protein